MSRVIIICYMIHHIWRKPCVRKVVLDKRLPLNGADVSSWVGDRFWPPAPVGVRTQRPPKHMALRWISWPARRERYTSKSRSRSRSRSSSRSRNRIKSKSKSGSEQWTEEYECKSKSKSVSGRGLVVARPLPDEEHVGRGERRDASVLSWLAKCCVFTSTLK